MTIKIANVDALGFAPGGARLAPLLETEGVRCLLVSLRAGEAVDPCTMTKTVVYVVLEGRGSLQVGDDETVLVSGSVAIVQKDVVRCIRAEEQMRLLVEQIA